MPEYIEREALLEKLQEELDNESPWLTKNNNAWFDNGLKCAINNVKSQPTADVVEVVRCANCIHLKTNIDKEKYCDIHSTTWAKFYVRFSDFCSFGERR